MHKVSLATQPSHRNNSLTCVALSLDWVRQKELASLAPLFWRKESTSLMNSSIQHFIQLFLSKASKQASSFLFFSGTVICGGHVTVAINTWNQSPTLSVPEENPNKTQKDQTSWFGLWLLFVNSSMQVLISNKKSSLGFSLLYFKFWTSIELFQHIFRMSYFTLTSSAF